MTHKIINFFLNILLFTVTIIIIIGFYYIYQLKIAEKNFVNLFGYTFFEVATASMYPTIEIGDVVLVKITKEIEENDIIIYIDDKSIIAHRLVEKNDNELIAKGDANNSEDKPVEMNMVLGKVVKIIPKLGTWRKVFTSKEIVGLVFLLLTLFGIAFVYPLKLEEKNDK